MAYERLTDDLDVISKLDTEPNDVGGLSDTELKAKFDEAANIIKDYINNTLLPSFEGNDGAENVGITGISQISEATNVQEALILICQLIEGISQGAIPDGSITTAKLAALAVTEEKLAALAVGTSNLQDDAVTEAKIADNAVSTDKIASKAVTSSKIDDGAIDATQLADGAVTNIKLGTGAVQSANLYDGAVVQNKIGAGAVTAEKIGANAVSTLYTATIDADDWVDGVNEVTVNGILATDKPIIDVDMTDVVDMSAVQDAFGAVLKITASANKLTVYADDAPSVDIPIKILCVRK